MYRAVIMSQGKILHRTEETQDTADMFGLLQRAFIFNRDWESLRNVRVRFEETDVQGVPETLGILAFEPKYLDEECTRG